MAAGFPKAVASGGGGMDLTPADYSSQTGGVGFGMIAGKKRGSKSMRGGFLQVAGESGMPGMSGGAEITLAGGRRRRSRRRSTKTRTRHHRTKSYGRKRKTRRR